MEEKGEKERKKNPFILSDHWLSAKINRKLNESSHIMRRAERDSA
jgi:hypothetical protein